MKLVALMFAFAACWSSSPASSSHPATTTAAKIHTCAIEPPIRTPQQLLLVDWLGRIGDRSWLLARHEQQLSLVGLAGAQLYAVPVGLETLRASYVAGTRLSLVGTRDARTYVVAFDVDAPRPRPTDARELADLGPLSAIDGYAVSSDLELLVERGHKVSFQLFDRAHRRLGPEVVINSSEPRAPSLRCSGDRCFAIGVEGDAQLRRLYAQRFYADGHTEHQVLAEDRVHAYEHVTVHDRTVVVWTSYDTPGLFMAVLDATGKLISRRAAIRGIDATPAAFELLPASPPRIALRDPDGEWVIATLDVSGEQLDEIRIAPLPDEATTFAGVVLPDGVLGAAGWTRGYYTAIGHTWKAQASATFVPTTRETEPPIEVLPVTGGEGRGGMGAFPLVEPGHAAILVVPTGFESSEGGELWLVRKPCP